MIHPLHIKPIALFVVSGVMGLSSVVALTVQPIDVTTTILALGMLLTAVGTLWTAIHTSRMDNKLQAVGTHVERVEGKVDGAATEQRARAANLQTQLDAALASVAEKRQDAALLAQAKATVDTAVAVPTNLKE